MLYKEKFAICSEARTQQMHVEFLKFKLGGT